MGAKLDLFLRHRETNEKFTYFVLTAAGASIAFAISQTKLGPLTFGEVPLGLAVALWAFSFYAGCRHIATMQSVTYKNYEYLRVRDGQHPEFPNHPQVIALIQSELDRAIAKSSAWGERQFKSLLAGAIFFIFWHVLEMALRTTALQNVPLLDLLR